MDLPQIHHRVVEIAATDVFYRDVGPPDAPTMLLLHGFPSHSGQFRRLLDSLGDRYRLVAPDYPGFGHSGSPAPADFEYSFAHLTDVMEGFVRTLGLGPFVLYLFDFGGPIGLRLAARHPEWVDGLVIQNANAYQEGLSDLAWAMVGQRHGVEGAAEAVRDVLTLPMTREQYVGGTSDPTLVPPDGWILDQHYLDQPGRAEIQVELALDYHTNVALYPDWQAWLRRWQPPALIVWGRRDAFFLEAGAHAYRRDLPDADLHLFDTGHFALEECAPQIAPLIATFLDTTYLDLNLASHDARAQDRRDSS